MGNQEEQKGAGDEMHFYVPDGLFYAIWRYSRPSLEPQIDHVDFDGLVPYPHYSTARVYRFLAERLKKLGLRFPKLYLYNDVPEDELHLPEAEAQLGKLDEKEQKRVLQAAENVRSDKFTQSDVETLLPVSDVFLQYVYFYTDLDAETQKKLKEPLDEYIIRFIKGELFVMDQNYLVFEKQKLSFMQKVQDMSAIRMYGENFVISHDVTASNKKSGEFLFIHALYALQHLGYLGVLRLWHSGASSTLSSDYTCHANVVLFDKFLDELNDLYHTENPTNSYGGFDVERGTLKLAGKSVTVSKGGKETYALQLIKTLDKEPEREWHEDEILEDWGYSDEERRGLPVNRIYQSAVKLNQLVIRQAKIDDFLVFNTEKFRINPKYIKSS